FCSAFFHACGIILYGSRRVFADESESEKSLELFTEVIVKPENIFLGVGKLVRKAFVLVLAITFAVSVLIGCGNGRVRPTPTAKEQATGEKETTGSTPGSNIKGETFAQENVPCRNGNKIRLVVPVYNRRGLEVVKTEFRPYITRDDVILVVSGNFNSLDLAWIDEATATLKRTYPDVPVFVGTGGLRNIFLIVEKLTQPCQGLVYVYEPNLPGEPEFTWDTKGTAANFKRAAELAHQRGLAFAVKPTGRPLLQNGLQKYGWDYGALAGTADAVFVQTQTYCKRSTDVFEKAIEKLQGQFEASGVPVSWVPEISVDPEAPNGVPVSRAVECAQIARAKGVTGVLVWWSPEHVKAALEFLRFLRAPFGVAEPETRQGNFD
ncbi:MAG: hypothetical protein QMD10_12760, partial [Desulfitobacteriaceae bacterium]|nr:hypothetical protein [Desulfitobacteriaceae bacterium]